MYSHAIIEWPGLLTHELSTYWLNWHTRNIKHGTRTKSLFFCKTQFLYVKKFALAFCIRFIRKNEKLKRTRETKTNQLVFLDFSMAFPYSNITSWKLSTCCDLCSENTESRGNTERTSRKTETNSMMLSGISFYLHWDENFTQSLDITLYLYVWRFCIEILSQEIFSYATYLDRRNIFNTCVTNWSEILEESLFNMSTPIPVPQFYYIETRVSRSYFFVIVWNDKVGIRQNQIIEK